MTLGTERKFKDVEPDVWQPEKSGDTIEGTLIRVVPAEGEISTRYYLEKDNLEYVLVWGSTVLDDRMPMAAIGSYVKIEFRGEEKTKKGRKVKLFRVSIGLPLDDAKEEDIN